MNKDVFYYDCTKINSDYIILFENTKKEVIKKWQKKKQTILHGII